MANAQRNLRKKQETVSIQNVQVKESCDKANCFCNCNNENLTLEQKTELVSNLLNKLNLSFQAKVSFSELGELVNMAVFSGRGANDFNVAVQLVEKAK